MKKVFNFTKIVMLALVFINYSCNSDDENNEIDIQALVQDIEVVINENPANGQVVGTVETNASGTLAFSITSQTPGGALTIDTTTGELTVADASLFDFETNPVIIANISVTGDINTATAIATISINNENELSIQDFIATINENPINGDIVGIVQAVGDGTLSFSITSQTPAGALHIDQNTGELSVADELVFDFETYPVVTADILVDNSGNMETLTATINLNNMDELSIQDLTTTVDENPTNAQSLEMVQASGDGTLNFSITSQTPNGALNIDNSTGELTVANATLFDFETNTSITATITVDNSIGTETATVTINLNDIHEVGDFKFGGVVFWVNATNDSGLVISAINNQPSGGPWGCHGVSIPGTNAAIGSGVTNTVVIETACTTLGTAADYATNLNFNGYDDWFLPSRDELLEYYANKNVVDAAMIANGGVIPNQFHWSSTELLGNTDNAALVNLTTGLWGNFNKSYNYGVRVVRTF